MLWEHTDIFKIVIVIFLCLGAISGIVFYSKADTQSVSTSVTISVCGNGTTEGNETCDDGNTIDGDGCSSTCQTEGGPALPPAEPGRTIPPSPEEVVYKTRVILEGKAYLDAQVNILKDGQFLTITKADSQANFRFEIQYLNAGTYTFGLWAEDKNGLRSPTFTITFYVAPAVTTTVGGILLPPTIGLDKTQIIKGETLKIFGQTVPLARVEIFVYSKEPSFKKNFEISTMANSFGDWYYFFDSSKLKEGIYEVRVKAATESGLISIFSHTLLFEVKSVVLPKPPIPPVPPIPPAPPVPGICPNADLNKDNRVNFIDFSILLYFWGRQNDCADQNADGIVDLIDFSVMMYWWTG